MHIRVEQMRWMTLLAAITMPLVAMFSNMGYFGPTNGEISNQYPTLIVAAGYAFSIWGVIFLLALAFGVADWRQVTGISDHTRFVIATGYLLTSSWMIIFSQLWFWGALAVMVGAFGCLLYAAIQAHDRGSGIARWALGLHAGWLTLALFLNIAQVIVAFEVLPTDAMLSWTVVLFLGSASVAAWALIRMRGLLAYAVPVIWGLIAVYVKQSTAGLPGGTAAAWLALTLAVACLLLTVALQWQNRKRTDAPLIH